MEKQRPEVTIEEAYPLSGSSSQSDSENELKDKRKPQRLNMLPTTGYHQTPIPRGMRPANSTVYDEEEDEDTRPERDTRQNYPVTTFLTTPILLVAASIGVGVLISIYGAKLLKPAIEKIVEQTAEEID